MTNLVRVVLVDPSHPGNIGSVARAMKNMALEDLVLVRPRFFPHADAVTLAAGADDLLARAIVVDSIEEAIADCGFVAATTSRPRSHNWDFLTPRDLAVKVGGLLPATRAALLFGSERFGLASEDLQYCNVLVRIPANPAYCSLNLAMSVQLLAYEIYLNRTAPQSAVQFERPLATGHEMELFYAHLQKVLDHVAFADRNGEGQLMTRLRRLFNRVQLDQNEINILRGIFTAVEGRRRRATTRPADEDAG